MDAGVDALPTVDGVLVDLTDGVLSVTLNRPSLNSVNGTVLAGIADAFEAAALDPRVKVARLGGTGRGFSSGAGIGADDAGSSDAGGDPVDVLHLANRAVRSIVELPRPVVSVVQGPTAGVGVSLALAGDLVLASEQAFFLLAFTKIGLMPDGGASALVAASVGRARAMRMALLAERIPAADALSWGLISAVYPADSFEAEVAAVLDTLRAGPVLSLAKTKHAINEATLTELAPALARETDGQIGLLAAADFQEGITAFQQRRAPTFTDS